MELKDEFDPATPEITFTENPFNGLESRHLGGVCKLNSYSMNPFNGIERGG
jgi:hypothetical protein